jgi:diacylglycerol kinase (ATP)
LKSFFNHHIQSFKAALTGLKVLLNTEINFVIECVIGSVMILLGFVYQISATEWLIQITISFAVLAAEAMNTAIEKLADFIHPDFHKSIGIVKDIAAAAVTLLAIAAVIIGFIIYLPKIFNL